MTKKRKKFTKRRQKSRKLLPTNLLTTISKGIEIPQALVYFISIWFFFFSFPSRLFNEYKRRIILGHHHFQTTTITAVISSDNTTKKGNLEDHQCRLDQKQKKRRRNRVVSTCRDLQNARTQVK